MEDKIIEETYARLMIPRRPQSKNFKMFDYVYADFSREDIREEMEITHYDSLKGFVLGLDGEMITIYSLYNNTMVTFNRNYFRLIPTEEGIRRYFKDTFQRKRLVKTKK